VLTGEYDADERAFAEALADVLGRCEWNGEEIHNGIRSAAEKSGLPIKRAFRTLYRAFIGRDRGPRLGYFFSTMEREFVVGRLKEIISGGH